ncbi:hypothetical protein FJ364_06130, partial [Candidatus Dependentiae bacterium]|nr:hypothetical protein [Candidatus Dependentiae bacterium]
MKRFVWLVIGVMSSAFFIHDSKATVAGKEKIIIDEDAEIEQLVKEAVKNYVPKKLPRAAKSKKTKATASITPSMYAAHYFYKPFKQPLVDLPSLLRKTAVTSEIEFSAHAAQNSYGPSGSRENLASRVFGKKDIQVQDLALVTRLAAKPGVAILQNSHNKDDFAQLAPIPVQFDAFTHREQVQLGASFACLEKKLRFNVGLPIVVGTNQLKVANDAGLQRVVNGVLAGDFKDYSLAQFIDALTSDMKMESKMGDRITSYGLGQGFIGATYQLPVKQLDQAHIGVQLYVPTTTKSDAKHVWPVELGIHNVALAVNTVLLWEKRRFFNPYVHANG